MSENDFFIYLEVVAPASASSNVDKAFISCCHSDKFISKKYNTKGNAMLYQVLVLD